jgi:hypothetical protein
VTKPEKALIIQQAVDEAYPIPSYLEEDVQTAIVKALVQIEREEVQSAEEAN